MTQYAVGGDAKHSVHVVLAEDKPINQKLAMILLTKAGHNVKLANEGQEAVDIFATSADNFDLIFMDVQLSELDGRETSIAIREKGFNEIPIVAMTAQAMKGDREFCFVVGMNDYITKSLAGKTVFEISRSGFWTRRTPK